MPGNVSTSALPSNLHAAALNQEINRVNRLHRLAACCANAVLRLHSLRDFADGDQHGLAALLELQAVVRELPALPLADDPFCRDEVVEIGGVAATSAHAAMLTIAQRTWDAGQLVSQAPSTRTEHQDDKGKPYARWSSKVVRRPPTEGTWSVDIWRKVCEGLDRCPALEADWCAAALALERTQAARALVFPPPADGAEPDATCNEHPVESVSIEQNMERIALAAGDDNTVKVLAVANRKDLSGDRRMEEILLIDRRFAEKDSNEWAALLQVTPPAVRGYKTWKLLRQRKREQTED
jgi:hypothetical protein